MAKSIFNHATLERVIVQPKFWKDTFYGFLLAACLSYFTLSYQGDPSYLKIIAFLWGVPIFYFYLVYIIYPLGEKAIQEFTYHAFAGSVVSVLFISLSFFMVYEANIPAFYVIIVMYGLVGAVLGTYFYNRLYLI